jgi:hypothetical protein
MSKFRAIAKGLRVRLAVTVNGPRGLGAAGQLGTVQAHDRGGLKVLLDGDFAPVICRPRDVVVLAMDDRPKPLNLNLPRHDVRRLTARFMPQLLPMLDEPMEDPVVGVTGHQRS